MKKILTLLLISVVILTSCGKSTKMSTEMKEWVEGANLDAQETAEELYEKALSEGVLTIYTVSSRIIDVADSFKKEYPNLQVDVIYTRAEELVGQVIKEADESQYKSDLIFATNGDGSLTQSLIPMGLAHKYLPWDIKDNMRSGGNEDYLSVLLEVPLLAYNCEKHTEPPVKNWWELTEPQWKDKVYITNPTRSMISYTLFSMMQQNEKKMEEAYKLQYGKDFEKVNGEGAYKTFLRGLVNNGLNIVNDSDDVADAIAKPGTDNDGIGIINASKMRLCESGYQIAMTYDMEPFAGVINPANIMIVGGSKNVNSAKLFVRWILGESDGKGEGYKPFLQEGAWPSRVDVTSPSRELDSFSAIYTDEVFTAKNRDSFMEFWQSLLQ